MDLEKTQATILIRGNAGKSYVMRAYRTGHVDLCTNLRADVKDASFRA